jgi:hypothetical protein
LTVIAAVVLILAYFVIMALPGPRSFFQLVLLPTSFWVAIIALTTLWVFVQRSLWRSNWIERFLDIAPDS